MLADNVTSTPRPLPPAKARRLLSMQYSRVAPPPPYEPSLDMRLISPLSSTAHLMSSLTSPDGLTVPPTSPAAMEDWMNEKSREELADLLVKADELIKSRETELGLTSSLCKTLYQDNIALKNKHSTLLSRIPSRGSSPAPSSPGSPLLVPTSMAKASFFYDDSRSLSSDYDLPSVSRPQHMRRISVTPAELEHLADQNAELLEKLQTLEEEAQLADQTGRRKLRKLEKEIQTLREELENTQAKEAALEQANAALNMSPSEVQRRKEEREERIRVLKEKSTPDSTTTFEEIKDFAPPSELPQTRIFSASSSFASQDDLRLSGLRSPSSPLLTPVKGGVQDEFAPAIPAQMTRTSSNPQAELAIVSQLLLKIQELEEANAQIKFDQNMTQERLRSAQWDAESIRRVYDCLGDGADVELSLVPEELASPPHIRSLSSTGTIKFSSLRREIHLDISRSSEMGDEPGDEPDLFSAGITQQSTTRSDFGLSNSSSGVRNGHKLRKSVVGLFDPLSDRGYLDPRSSLMAPSPLGTPSELGDISVWSVAATDGQIPPSPTGSLQTPIDASEPTHTLGSELGSEFGDDWGENAGNHHLRASSLYDITGLNLSRDMSASPVVPPGDMPAFTFPSRDDLAPSPSTEREWGVAAGPSTPPRAVRGLQLTVEPPTPEYVKSTRAQRLSQTMRLRTNRWVERRFDAPSPSLSEPVRLLRRQRTASGIGRGSIDASMNDTFEEVLQAFSRAGSLGSIAPLAGASPDPCAEDDLDEDGNCSAIELHHEGSAALDAAGAQRDGFVGFMLEVWLWLQFAIVVLVFLWTMARRGPKSMLEDAERRRVQHGA